MLEQSCVSVTDEAGWRSALADVPHAFAHTVECCRAIQLTTNAPTWLFVLGSGDARVACPLSERTYAGYIDVFTPYQFSGFSGSGAIERFNDHWRSFALDRGWVAGYHAMHPLLPNETYYSAADCFVQNDLYVLDLRQSADAMLSLFDRSRRRELRTYSPDDRLFACDHQALTSFLIEEYPAFLTRVGAPCALSPATLAAFAQAESVLLIGAATDGLVEAVYLFGYTRSAGDCLLNVATPAGRRHSTALLWRGMLELKKRGVPTLNLGGGVRRGDRVAQAKERFGPTKVPLRSVKQVYRPEVFEELCRASGTEPGHLGGYFPPYQRRWSS